MAWKTRRIASERSQMYGKVREVLGLWSYVLDQAGMSVDKAQGQGSNGNEQSKLNVYMMARLLSEKAQAILTNETTNSLLYLLPLLPCPRASSTGIPALADQGYQQLS